MNLTQTKCLFLEDIQQRERAYLAFGTFEYILVQKETYNNGQFNQLNVLLYWTTDINYSLAQTGAQNYYTQAEKYGAEQLN